jgi:small-conductance mechanosensitive channel/CRP-like cAMP-binding protein
VTSVIDTPWFFWAVGVAIGFPLALLVLTEVQNALRRRGSVLVRPVTLLRNYILPLGALLVLLIGAMQVSGEATPVRIVSTVFGFVVLVLLLSGLNATLFQRAPEGTWRRRIPSIFLDVARFALIAVGVGLIFAYIWGANVGGLFTALGVSTIVLGLALQNSVGQIISGLLVLFEQPFQLGDWVDTPSAKGRVVEVNWRATHIDTGSGLQIMPNSVLAAASFTNLSRPPGTHWITIDTVFSRSDPPEAVCGVLDAVARMLPQVAGHVTPSSVPIGGTGYQTSIPLRTPADAFAARSTFLRWTWYAARREGLHLDEIDDDFATCQRLEEALRVIAPTLRLTHTDRQVLLPRVRITRYAAEETVQTVGEVPTRMTFVVAGRIRLVASGPAGELIPVRTLTEGDFLGQTALTREPVLAGAFALDEVTVLQIDRDDVEELVSNKPLLLQDIGRAIEERKSDVQRVLTAAHDG